MRSLPRGAGRTTRRSTVETERRNARSGPTTMTTSPGRISGRSRSLGPAGPSGGLSCGPCPSNGFGSSDQTLLQNPLVVFVLGMKPRLIQDAITLTRSWGFRMDDDCMSVHAEFFSSLPVCRAPGKTTSGRCLPYVLRRSSAEHRPSTVCVAGTAGRPGSRCSTGPPIGLHLAGGSGAHPTPVRTRGRSTSDESGCGRREVMSRDGRGRRARAARGAGGRARCGQGGAGCVRAGAAPEQAGAPDAGGPRRTRPRQPSWWRWRCGCVNTGCSGW